MLLKLKDTVDHDGRRSVAGDEIEVANDGQAQALIAAGVADAVKGAKPGKAG